MLRIHDEFTRGLVDKCEEECAEHRSTLPAVGASEGVGAEAAGADAAATTQNAVGTDAASAAFSRSAGSTEVVRGSFAVEAQEARAKRRCRFLGTRCCLAKQMCQCGEIQ